jgi:hypothetical protein
MDITKIEVVAADFQHYPYQNARRCSSNWPFNTTGHSTEQNALRTYMDTVSTIQLGALYLPRLYSHQLPSQFTEAIIAFLGPATLVPLICRHKTLLVSLQLLFGIGLVDWHRWEEAYVHHGARLFGVVETSIRVGYPIILPHS